MFAEYETFDALGLANLVRQGVVSPAELLATAIERIESRNPALNAVIYKMYDQAEKTVKKNLPEGPFQGVPILLKDLLAECEGAPLGSGSRYTQHWVSSYDSELIKRMKQSGVVIVGKTNTPEFGLSPVTEPDAFGATRNPWDLTRTSGGSSGGSAAAVAAGMVPMAHGGDGAGSIRIPAAFCGLFGLKPTRGRTPTGPNFTRVWQGMVVEHVITRSVRDSAAMLDVLSGPEVGSPISLPKPTVSFLDSLENSPHRLRIAMIAEPAFSAKVDPEYKQALEKTAQLCQDLGHEIELLDIKFDAEEMTKAFLIVIAGETAADLRLLSERVGRRPKRHELESQTAVLCEVGEHFTAADFASANHKLDLLSRQIAEYFETYDLLMSPTMATPPPRIGYFDPDRTEQTILEMLRWVPQRQLLLKFIQTAGMRNFSFAPFTPLFNISGHPAMSVPLYWDSQGLPIGIQFAGKIADEATLLQLAKQLEEANPWVNQRPKFVD